MQETMRKYPVPAMVVGKANATGEIGRKWLDGLDELVDMLTEKWNIRVENVLHGGSHALVCSAVGANNEPYVLKVEIPDISETEFMYGVNALRIADGNGYAKLIAFDIEHRAWLLERLGKPLKQSGYSAEKQMRIICAALLKTWEMPVGDTVLPNGADSLDWFSAFIPQTWEKLKKPCPEKVINRAMQFLESRKAQCDPAEFVLLHGDAHNNNTLQVPGKQEEFKLIDAEGILYEKAYDLGVLMREWPEAYCENPAAGWHARAEFLHGLTGVDTQAILEWGFLQMVSTGLLLLQIGESTLGTEMLQIAEAWCE